jgi:hypothetical protein
MIREENENGTSVRAICDRIPFFSKPKIMLIIDIILFTLPAIVMFYAVDAIPPEYVSVTAILTVQALISLPVLMTLATIISG